ncbi:hypothetical protein ACN28E_30465 [Archangium lansingense]|uniref:hypothetical protein n=1 Tax=Archangium lansingense TaxID=2995310 RepID=UPI003B7A56F4
MNTEPVSVLIKGENFLPRATQHIGGEAPVTMDAHFEAFLGDVALEEVTWVDGRTLQARIPAGLTPGWHSLVVAGPLGRRVELPRAYLSSAVPLARLEAQASLAQVDVTVEQRTWLTLMVENTGEAAALSVAPVLSITGEGRVEVISEPGPADIAAGASASFAWELEAAEPGDVRFSLQALGREEMTGAELRAPVVETGPLRIRVPVQLPGALVARFFPLPASVNVGQEFDIELEVTNPGDVAVLGVKPEATGSSGTGEVKLAQGSQPEPASVDIPGKGRAVFRARLVGSREGSCVFHAGARGVEQTSGAPVVASPVNSSTVIVRWSSALTATLSAPSRVKRGNTFGVSLKVTNTGSTVAEGVTPSLPESSTNVAELLSGPSSAPLALAGGASATFTWSYRAAKPGKASFSAEAGGRDGNTGAVVVTGLVSSAEVTIVPEVEQLLPDPLGDGSPFAHVLGYDGRVFVGPNKSGTGGVSVDLDGRGGRSFGFFLRKDTTGNFSQNASAAPYPSIGATGCRINTSECGPDNEDGRGFFFSGWVGSQEWLGLGGAKSGGSLDYVYLGQDTDDLNTMYMRHLDLSVVLGPQTRGFSAALFFQDRLYLGFPDTGGSRPSLLVVKRLPMVDPGYNASSGMDVENLTADEMPGISVGGSPRNTAPMQMIDTMAGFNARLYLANNGGCVRSTMPTPRSYGLFPGDWTSCTPSLPAWNSRTGRTTTKTADLEPTDKAVPQLAVFQGRLYLARNTTSTAGVRGPQLFVCNPDKTGSTGDCDPGDWSLVAPNSTGDKQFTQFNDPDNVSLSLLVATANGLYVGFDNASRGVVLLRASTPAPLNRSDFTGLAGCSAAQFPAGCAGLGGNGLGAGATRIFDGKALGASGSESVYLTAGNGTGPAGLFRLMD